MLTCNTKVQQGSGFLKYAQFPSLQLPGLQVQAQEVVPLHISSDVCRITIVSLEDGQRKVTNVQTLVRRLGKWPLHIGSQMIKLGPLPGCCGFCHCSYWNSSEHIAPCFLRLCFERLCERYSFFKMEILDNKLLHGSISEESSRLQNTISVYN